MDEAVFAFCHAIELKPDYAEAHYTLANALSLQGDFARALAAAQWGHELGSRRPDWVYPSAEWVKRCQRLVGIAVAARSPNGAACAGYPPFGENAV